MKPFVFFFCFVAAVSAASADKGCEAAKRLLSSNPGATIEEMLRYAHACEKTAAADLPIPAQLDLYKRTGDIYYEINMVRYAADWNKWYRRAVKLDTALANNTPIGFRFKEYKKIALRLHIISGVYFVYIGVLLFFLFRIVRNAGSFDARFFLKRLVLFLGLFIAAAVVVFTADGLLFKKICAAGGGDIVCAWSAGVGANAILKPILSFVSPIIPFSVTELTARAAIILLLGFMPIALALLYVSFRRPFSRIGLFLVVFLSVAALWTHFLMVTGFDVLMNPTVLMTKSRIIYRGEPEEILLKNPEKALRANPDLLKSDNDDLAEFIRTHFPHGFPQHCR
jgi:hypothetical protein